MAKNRKGEKITLIGGNKADEVNPKGLVRKFKAVCVTEHEVISPAWRNTKAEAIADAQPHLNKGHFIDFDIKISKQ
jgi:hypothetical protein